MNSSSSGTETTSIQVAMSHFVLICQLTRWKMKTFHNSNVVKQKECFQLPSTSVPAKSSNKMWMATILFMLRFTKLLLLHCPSFMLRLSLCPRSPTETERKQNALSVTTCPIVLLRSSTENMRLHNSMRKPFDTKSAFLMRFSQRLGVI